MSLESDGGMILTGENRITRRKTCPSATLSTTNPTFIEPGANPGLRGERPATNDLSHGTANQAITIKEFSFRGDHPCLAKTPKFRIVSVRSGDVKCILLMPT
jgi:hypothetical protein